MDVSQCVSIDFSPQVLHDADEAECIREDQERNRQVKECLDTMFADMDMHDFENAEDEDEEEEAEKDEAEDGGYADDDDHGEIDGREHTVESFGDDSQSHNFDDEHVMGDGLRNWPPPLNHPWPMMVQGTQQTSTPRGDNPPPALSTPTTVPRGYYSDQQRPHSVDTSDVEPEYISPTDPDGESSQYWMENDHQFGYDEQGNVVGTEIDYQDPVYHPDQFVGGYPQGYPMAYLTNGIFPGHQGVYHDGGFNLIHEAPQSMVGNFLPAPYPSVTPTLPVSRDDFRSEVEATFTEGDLDLEAKLPAKSGLRSPMKLSTLQAPGRDVGLDSYRVQFAKPSLGGGSDGEVGRPRQGVDALGLSAPKGVEVESVNAQENFLHQDGSRDGHQMTQLQILYNARGKRIEELTKEMDSVKDELSREIRLLKHELSLARGQWDGARDSLEECQHLLTEAMTSKSRSDGQVAALQLQIASLRNDNEELTKKIISAESTIESLNAQLSESRSTDNWTRAKQHYETTIATLKHKQETEILRMKQQIDEMTHRVETKDEELVSLRKRVADVTKEAELAQISRAESINRLARSLHDSQDQCNQLLESGAGQELSRLKLQIHDLQAGKSFADDMNTALQSELQELKEQVTMYESMSQFGLLPGGATISTSRPSGGFSSPPIDPDDSYAQLGIKNPHPMRGNSEMSSTSEMLFGLKNELERCVRLYREKRLQVAALQSELKAAKTNLMDVTGRLESTTKSLQEKEAKLEETRECRPGQGIAEKRLEREVERISKEKDELVKELQELQIRLEEACTSEQQATEHCRELSRQMSDLVKEHDEDKRQAEADQKLALERCQAALLEHHERAKEQTRQAMMEESEEKMRKVRRELESLEQELDETKRLYVEACEKRDEVEEEVNTKWRTTLEEQLEELRQQITLEKEQELEHLRSTLTTDAVAMTADNTKWLQEERKRLEKEMDARLLKAEEDWRLSHKAETEEAIWSAEVELKKSFDVQMKEELAKAVENCQSDLRSKLQQEIEAGINRAKEDWQSTEMAEWKTKQLELELEKAKEDWRTNELPKELDRARDEWARTMVSRDTTFQAKAIAEAKARWERDELSVAVEKAKQEFSMMQAKAIAEAKARWERYELSVAVEKAKQEIPTMQTKAIAEAKARWERDELSVAVEKAKQEFPMMQAKAIAEAKARWERDELSVAVEKAKQEVRGQIEVRSAQVRASLERDWTERLETAAREHSQQMATLQALHKEELTKAHDAMEREWHERLEAAVKEMDLQAKAAKKDLLQLADEHNKSEIAKHESTFQKHLTARVSDYEQQLTAVLHANEQLQEQLQLIQTLAEQQEQQLAADFEEAKIRWNGELEELRTELERRKQMEKERDSLRQAVEMAEEEKCEALRRKEEDFRDVLANYQRQVEILGDKLGRAERVFKGLEAKTQRRLSSLQESLEREHAVALAQLEARLVEQSGEHDLEMEALRRKCEEEAEALREEMELEKRKKGDVQGLQASQVKALEEMRNYYLQAIAKVKDEVFTHLEQTGKQNAEVLRQRLMRERRRTARHLRKYYLRCFDQLLQRDFDSSFRANALQAMQNLLDNMSDRDTSPNSLFSSASELTTPRDDPAPPSRPLDAPNSNEDSAKSSFRKLPPGVIRAESGTDQARLESLTPTLDNQSVGDTRQRHNLYFESPSGESRERLKSADRAGLRSDREEFHETSERDCKVKEQNEDVVSTERGPSRYQRSSSSSLRKDVVSSLTTDRTVSPSDATGTRHVSEKSRASQNKSSSSSLKPRSDATFVMTRAASVQYPATVSMTTDSRVAMQNGYPDDDSESAGDVGMATSSKKTDDYGNEYVYTSLSQRLKSPMSEHSTGQFSTLKSWSVSDLTRSTGYSAPKLTVVSYSQMASSVSHGLTATSNSRPLATSSLHNIPSLSGSGVQKAATKSPFSYSNFSLSATSHKPAVTLSHVPFTTPPVSHASSSSHVAPVSFSQNDSSVHDHAMGGMVFDSRGAELGNYLGNGVSTEEFGSRRQGVNVGVSNRPVIRESGVQALGRETRK